MSEQANSNNKIMTAEKLLAIHADLAKLGVEIYLDGGWGVDALLGEQTREHKDIDFLIEKKNLETVKNYLDSNNYKPTDEPATWWHFSMENNDAIIDIHVVEFDGNGDGIYGPKENGAVFPAYAFGGEGKVNGVIVKCLTAQYRVTCLTKAFGVVTRTGYTLRDSDYEDIAKLCKKFTIEMPEEYLQHWGGKLPY